MEEKRQEKRSSMPRCAQMVDEFAQRFGAKHVRDAVAAGKAGEPGAFYAYEQTADGVQKVGTPPEGADAQRLREIFKAFGAPAALVVMAPPESEQP